MNSVSRLEDDHGDSTIVPMLQPTRGSLDKSVSHSTFELVQRIGYLIGGLASITLSVITILLMVRNKSHISGAIFYFWACVGVSLLLVLGYNLLSMFISNRPRKSSEESKICAVEVCIDNETVLTVRSWWPADMSRSEAERNGTRVAMSSARRWISDNAHHGGKTSRIRFTHDTAITLSEQYLTRPCHTHHDHQCSVCLDHVSTPGMQLLGCGHIFHSECLASWFAQSGKLTCPMCRTDHHQFVPQSVLMQHVVKEEPTVSVLTITVETGVIPTDINIY